MVRILLPSLRPRTAGGWLKLALGGVLLVGLASLGVALLAGAAVIGLAIYAVSHLSRSAGAPVQPNVKVIDGDYIVKSPEKPGK